MPFNFREYLAELYPEGSSVFGLRILSTKMIHETPWMGVGEVTYQRGDEEPTSYTLIVDPTGAGVVLLTPDKQRIILVRQIRLGHRTHNWEIPLECSEPGESVSVTALRAASEEAGANATLICPLLTVCPTPRSTDETKTFLAVATQDIGDFDRNELTEVADFSFAEVEAMIAAGQITEGISLASLCRFLFLQATGQV